MTDDLAFLDAVAQADLVRNQQLSPLELVDAAITRIEKLNGELNAVIHPRFDQARTEADGELPDGPFTYWRGDAAAAAPQTPSTSGA